MSIFELVAAAEAILLVGSLPLAIWGTAQLVMSVVGSTEDDRLARWIVAYLSVVTACAIYLGVLVVVRTVTGGPTPEWTRPITGALALAVLLGPWWISRVARS